MLLAECSLKPQRKNLSVRVWIGQGGTLTVQRVCLSSPSCQEERSVFKWMRGMQASLLLSLEKWSNRAGNKRERWGKFNKSFTRTFQLHLTSLYPSLIQSTHTYTYFTHTLPPDDSNLKQLPHAPYWIVISCHPNTMASVVQFREGHLPQTRPIICLNPHPHLSPEWNGPKVNQWQLFPRSLEQELRKWVICVLEGLSPWGHKSDISKLGRWTLGEMSLRWKNWMQC